MRLRRGVSRLFAGGIAEKVDLGVVLRKRAHIIGSTLRNRSNALKTDLIAAFQVRLPLNLSLNYASAVCRWHHDMRHAESTLNLQLSVWKRYTCAARFPLAAYMPTALHTSLLTKLKIT